MADDIRLRVLWDGVQKFISDGKKAEQAIDGVYRDVNGKLRDAQGKFVAENRKSALSIGEFSLSLGGLKKLLGGYWMSQAAFEIGHLLSSTVKLGLGATVQLEQVKTGFKTMLGSASEANQLVKDLQHFSDWSPYEDSNIYDWSQGLVGIGAKAQQVVPILTALGDAAAAMGQGPEAVSGSLTAIEQIAAKGRLQGDELLQLMEHKIFAQDILQKGLGLNSAQFQKALENGSIKSSVAIPMILRGLEAKYGAKNGQPGALQAQSQTIGGYWSTIKSGLMRAITADPDSPFATALRTWLGHFASDSNMKEVQARIRDVLSHLWDMGKAAKNFWDNLVAIEQSRGAQRLLRDIGDALKWVWNTLGDVLFPIESLIGYLGGARPSEISGTLNNIAAFAENPYVQGFLEGVAVYTTAMWGLSAATSAAAGAMETLKTAQQGITGASVGGPVGIIALVITGVTLLHQHVASARRYMDDLWHDITKHANDWQGIWAAIKAPTGPLGWFISLLMDLGKATGYIDRMADAFGTVNGAIKGVFVGLWDGMKSAFVDALNWCVDQWNSLGINGPGGIHIGVPSMSQIAGGTPKAARGVTTTSSGLVQVGDAGREILSLPRGASVIPVQRTQGSAALAGGGGVPALEVYLDGKQLTAAVHRREDTGRARR